MSKMVDERDRQGLYSQMEIDQYKIESTQQLQMLK